MDASPRGLRPFLSTFPLVPKVGLWEREHRGEAVLRGEGRAERRGEIPATHHAIERSNARQPLTLISINRGNCSEKVRSEKARPWTCRHSLAHGPACHLSRAPPSRSRAPPPRPHFRNEQTSRIEVSTFRDGHGGIACSSEHHADSRRIARSAAGRTRVAPATVCGSRRISGSWVFLAHRSAG